MSRFVCAPTLLISMFGLSVALMARIVNKNQVSWSRGKKEKKKINFFSFLFDYLHPNTDECSAAGASPIDGEYFRNPRPATLFFSGSSACLEECLSCERLIRLLISIRSCSPGDTHSEPSFRWVPGATEMEWRGLARLLAALWRRYNGGWWLFLTAVMGALVYLLHTCMWKQIFNSVLPSSKSRNEGGGLGVKLRHSLLINRKSQGWVACMS